MSKRAWNCVLEQNASFRSHRERLCDKAIVQMWKETENSIWSPTCQHLLPFEWLRVPGCLVSDTKSWWEPMATHGSGCVIDQTPWDILDGIEAWAAGQRYKGPRFVQPGKMKSKRRDSFLCKYGRINLTAVLYSWTLFRIEEIVSSERWVCHC